MFVRHRDYIKGCKSPREHPGAITQEGAQRRITNIEYFWSDLSDILFHVFAHKIVTMFLSAGRLHRQFEFCLRAKYVKWI